jgi:hypothetical protein
VQELLVDLANAQQAGALTARELRALTELVDALARLLDEMPREN